MKMNLRFCTVAIVALSIVVVGVVETQAGRLSAGSRGGKYTGTDNRGDGESIWSGPGQVSENDRVLNPRGDANGDLWPTVVESPIAPNYPWVVWSRFNGTGYDLAWSRFQNDNWRPITWLQAETSAGDDLDPDMAFDHKGVPYLAWWRDNNGTGEVYISVYLNNNWLRAVRITPIHLDSRNPTVRVNVGGKLMIEYQTPLGLMMQAAFLHQPNTITDDINPYIRLVGDAMVVGRGNTKGR